MKLNPIEVVVENGIEPRPQISVSMDVSRHVLRGVSYATIKTRFPKLEKTEHHQITYTSRSVHAFWEIDEPVLEISEEDALELMRLVAEFVEERRVK